MTEKLADLAYAGGIEFANFYVTHLGAQPEEGTQTRASNALGLPASRLAFDHRSITIHKVNFLKQELLCCHLTYQGPPWNRAE